MYPDSNQLVLVVSNFAKIFIQVFLIQILKNHKILWSFIYKFFEKIKMN